MADKNNDLISAIKKGEIWAYEDLFKKYYMKTVNWANGWLKDKKSAEDVAQNVFLKIWLNRESLLEKCNIDHYIFILARNEAFDIIKKRASKKKYENRTIGSKIGLSLDGNETINTFEIKAILEQVVDKMPEKRKQVFTLSREKWLTNKEISTKLKISKRTVEKHLNLALKEIRNALRDFLGIFLFF